jgi:hypothetical protein
VECSRLRVTGDAELIEKPFGQRHGGAARQCSAVVNREVDSQGMPGQPRGASEQSKRAAFSGSAYGRSTGGSDAELASFVACRRHDAALTGSADGDRLAAEIRIVPLLDRCVERVHIDVDDLPLKGCP